MAMNREQKRMLQRQGTSDEGDPPQGDKTAPAGQRPRRSAPPPGSSSERCAVSSQGGLADPSRGHELLDHRAGRGGRVTAFVGGLDYGFGEGVLLKLFEQ